MKIIIIFFIFSFCTNHFIRILKVQVHCSIHCKCSFRCASFSMSTYRLPSTSIGFQPLCVIFCPIVCYPKSQSPLLHKCSFRWAPFFASTYTTSFPFFTIVRHFSRPLVQFHTYSFPLVCHHQSQTLYPENLHLKVVHHRLPAKRHLNGILLAG